MIFRLGVTGGIGSGKSTVCKTFNVLGIPVFSADEEGRIITDSDPELRDSLNELIGEDMFASGQLDREKLASLIFNDSELLSRVNMLVHPRVLNKYNDWCSRQTSHYIIFEAAILFEAGAEQKVDMTLAVTAPLEERVKRVMERNKMSREQVMERVNNQISDDEIIRRSDFHINNADNEMIIPRVLDIHQKILNHLNKD